MKEIKLPVDKFNIRTVYQGFGLIPKCVIFIVPKSKQNEPKLKRAITKLRAEIKAQDLRDIQDRLCEVVVMTPREFKIYAKK